MRRKWLILGSIILVAVVIGIGEWSLHQLTQLSRRNTSKDLLNVLESTTHGVGIWIQDHISGAMDLAVSRDLRLYFDQQLKQPRNRKSLLQSPALPRIRSLIGRHAQLLHFFDFSLVTPDHIVIASDNDQSIGRLHLLVSRDNFLDRVFSGESIIIPPMPIEFDILESQGEPLLRLPVMFVAVPVTDDSGQVFAALIFHLDPEEGFSPIAQMGRLGRTGETYFFDKNGMMLSNSRFEEQLRKTGLLNIHQTSITNIQIHDPGGNIPEGFRPEMPVEKWPLTLAVTEATSGRPGYNLEGYRDYRGVPVVGAWTWQDQWGFGIVTELDLNEAYESTHAIRRLQLGVMAALIAVFVVAGFLLHRSRMEALRLSDNLAGAMQDLEAEVHERRRAESFLRSSENRVRLLLDSTSEAIYGLDQEGNCTFANPSCARLLGYDDPSELLGRNMHELIHHTRADGTPLAVEDCKIYKAFIVGEETHEEDDVLWRADGSSFPVEYWSHPTIQNGRTTGAVVTFLDITKRKKTQQALRESEEKYRHLFQHAQIGMFRVSTDGNTVLAVNEKLGEILGYSTDEMLALDSTGIWADPADWEKMLEQADEASAIHDFEINLTTRNGETRNALASFRKYGEKGFIEGSIVDVTEQRQAREKLDEYRNHLERLVENRTRELEVTNRELKEEIKERQRAEASLRISEQRLQDIVDNTAAVVFVKDTRGHYQLINKTGAKVLGKRPDEIIGLSDFDLFPEELAKKIKMLDDKIMQDGNSVEMEEEIPAKEGRDVFLTNKFPLRDITGVIYGICGISTDISKRKIAEEAISRARDEAEAANRAKSEFLANMSHEIRTPMNGIIGMNELVLGTDLNDEQRDYIETALSSARSLLTLLNDILDLSKIESNRMVIESTPFLLEQLVFDSVNSLITQANEKGLELAVRINAELPPQLEGDPTRLRQILTNLVGNAVKFTNQGEVVVNVDPEPESADKDMIRFTVRDTGIGIPLEKQEIIFSNFTQADGSTTREYGGSGLGLTISKRLVEIMGGRIWIEDHDGPGVTFLFSIPLKVNKDSLLEVPPMDLELDKDLSVLIVDDNLTNRRILEETARRWGMRSTLAERGAAALDILEQGAEFDLMLIDFNMPEMNGLDLVRKIKERRYKEGQIILLTSAGIETQTFICRTEGVAACLYKPVGQTQLYHAILKILGKSPANQDFRSVPRPPAPSGEFLGARILVAEDNPVNQMLASRLLEKKGYAVTVVSNGAMVLRALSEGTFDLILMDIQMPEMDGMETTRLIRLRERQGVPRIPIVAMTAHAMKGDRERFIEAGMDDYVSKPFNSKELYEIVSSLTK